MPGMQRPYIKALRNTKDFTVDTGAATMRFTEANTRMPPYLWGTANITATGLDGGTFKWTAVCMDNVERQIDATAYAGTAIARIDETVILDGIKVILSDCGVDADPVITLVVLGRAYRFDTGM